jgi:type VI secretion system lysozyme-like protein
MVRYSILDRLLREPTARVEETLRHPSPSREMIYRAQVEHDLECLLNTRRICDILPESQREVARSIYFYGLEDLSRFSLIGERTEQERGRLAASIRRTIEIFEPRIRGVEVIVPRRRPNDVELRFQIAGSLFLEGKPEPVRYDTVFDSARGSYNVSETAHA